jgi:hypothetical protein
VVRGIADPEEEARSTHPSSWIWGPSAAKGEVPGGEKILLRRVFTPSKPVRSAGAVAAADEQDALAVVDAQNEAPLDHVGEDGDALGRAQHGRRDRLDLQAAELVERLAGAGHGLDLVGPLAELQLAAGLAGRQHGGDAPDERLAEGDRLTKPDGAGKRRHERTPFRGFQGF